MPKIQHRIVNLIQRVGTFSIVLLLIWGCARVKLNYIRSAEPKLTLSNFIISVSIYEREANKITKRPDIQIEFQEEIYRAIVGWAGTSVENLGQNEEFNYEFMKSIWKEGPSTQLAKHLAPLPGAGPRLAINVRGMIVPKIHEFIRTAGVFVPGPGPKILPGDLDIDQINFIWAIVLPGGKVAAVGNENGKNAKEKKARQKIISSAIKEIRNALE